jgi:large subunit ribosomal protein L29
MAYESLTNERVRAMKDEELAVLSRELRDKAFLLRSQAVTEKVEDTSQFGKIKKDIARIETERSARRKKSAA